MLVVEGLEIQNDIVFGWSKCALVLGLANNKHFFKLVDVRGIVYFRESSNIHELPEMWNNVMEEIGTGKKAYQLNFFHSVYEEYPSEYMDGVEHKFPGDFHFTI